MENANTVEEGKTIAIISYITLIGLIIAFIMNNDKKNSFASYHIRQSIGIIGIYILLAIFFTVLSFIVYIPFLSTILYLGVFVLLILGLLSAVQGETKPVPLVGEKFQEWFKNIG